MVKTKKGDFIEIEFVAKTDEQVFDTNIKSEAEKAGLQINTKPFILAIGKEMTIKGFDADLENKEIGKSYSVKIKPENAFGKRNPQLVKTIPLKAFREQNINPQRGMQLSLDGRTVRVLSSSGGRVLVDYNHPLAGRPVEYDYKIKRKVEKQEEKINSVQDFLFRKQFPFKTTDKKVILKLSPKEKQFQQFLFLMREPFQKILDLELDLEIQEDKKEKNTKSKKEINQTQQKKSENAKTKNNTK